MKTPKGYQLEIVKLLSGGGLSATYRESTKDKSITNVDTHKIDSPTDPHPDLTEAMDKLKPFVADVYAMRTYRAFNTNPKSINAKEQEAIRTLKVAFDKLDIEVLRKIEIKELVFKGEEDSAGVIIKATLNHNGYTSALNTPLMVFCGDSWGFEEKIDEITDVILEEVEEYLFNAKASQHNLFKEPNGKEQKENKPKAANSEEEKEEVKVDV